MWLDLREWAQGVHLFLSYVKGHQGALTSEEALNNLQVDVCGCQLASFFGNPSASRIWPWTEWPQGYSGRDIALQAQQEVSLLSTYCQPVRNREQNWVLIMASFLKETSQPLGSRWILSNSIPQKEQKFILLWIDTFSAYGVAFSASRARTSTNVVIFLGLIWCLIYIFMVSHTKFSHFYDAGDWRMGTKIYNSLVSPYISSPRSRIMDWSVRVPVRIQT